MINANLMLLKLKFNVIAQAAISAGNPQLKVQAFYKLAFWMLSQFAEHELLNELRITTVYKLDSHPKEQLVELGHHVKFVAIGADLGLGDATAQESFAQSLVPLAYTGNGTVTLTAAHELVREFLSAQGDPSTEALEAIVFKLASRLVLELGKLTIVHRMNSVM